MTDAQILEPTAAASPIFETWKPETKRLWGKVPVRLRHTLAGHPLFTDEALARLIETYPRDHYQLVQPPRTPGGQSRDGDLTGVSGETALAAIAKGRMWLNLRNVAEVDERYAALMREIFAETKAELPDFRTFAETIGIFISSPGGKTHYHADLPGQSLWQIRGSKTIYIYEPIEPFLSRRQIETITISNTEFIGYEKWYDDHAKSFRMGPGDMMHWPLNAPHRIDNDDALSVSMTMEFFTPEIRRRHIVNRANAIMRLLKVEPRSATTTGPGFYAKAVLQRALRDAPFVKRLDVMRERRASWRPDPSRPDAVADLTA